MYLLLHLLDEFLQILQFFLKSKRPSVLLSYRKKKTFSSIFVSFIYYYYRVKDRRAGVHTLQLIGSGIFQKGSITFGRAKTYSKRLSSEGHRLDHTVI